MPPGIKDIATDDPNFAKSQILAGLAADLIIEQENAEALGGNIDAQTVAIKLLKSVGEDIKAAEKNLLIVAADKVIVQLTRLGNFDIDDGDFPEALRIVRNLMDKKVNKKKRDFPTGLNYLYTLSGGLLNMEDALIEAMK